MNTPSTHVRAGELNPVFGGGHVNLDHTGDDALLSAMEPTADGGLLVLSRRPLIAGYYVSRFTEAGLLDPAFGTQGGFFHDTQDGPTNLHLLAGERFLVAGASGNDLIAHCYNADGTLHVPYGNNGRVRVPVTELVVHEGRPAQLPEQAANGLPGRSTVSIKSLVAGDKLFLVFTVWWGGFRELMSVVVRLDGEGRVDATFNRSGYFLVTMAGTDVVYNFPLDAVLQPSTHPDHQAVVLLVQESEGTSADDKYLLCVTAQGLDYGFGQSALLPGYVPVPQSAAFEAGALLSGAGGLRVIGSTGYENNEAGVVFGFTAQGMVDRDFNNGEPLLTPGERGWSLGYVYGEGAGERMVLLTYLFKDGSKIALVRLLADGQRDPDFGEDGTVAIPHVAAGWLALPKLRITSAPARDVLLGFKTDVYWLLGG